MKARRNTATHLRYARRDRKILADFLDRAAADLATCARAADDGRPIDPSDLRQRSSDYAKVAHNFGPRKGE